MPHDDSLKRVERLARESLRLWPVPDGAKVTLINVSENVTYRIESNGHLSILRVHRAAYHTKRGIEQELAWSKALSDDGKVLAPSPIRGVNGELVQEVQSTDLSERRFMVMFEFVKGRQPEENEDLVERFERLGAIAARTHIHSQNWFKPTPFERPLWNTEALLGSKSNWGDWRDAPNVTPVIREVLEQVEALLFLRLDAFGRGNDRYGLIHADMRLANLLIDGENTWLIDFDDCGLGWFLYDFATSISFIENHPQVPALRQAWIKGYRTVRPLSDSEDQEIDTFIMLRRMALLAWIGSHIDAPEPQALASHFAQGTERLGRAYLIKFAAMADAP